MSLIRLWKSPEARFVATGDDQANLEHPSGISIIEHDALDGILGAATEQVWSLGCCGGLTSGDCGNSVQCATRNTYPCPSAYASCTC